MATDNGISYVIATLILLASCVEILALRYTKAAKHAIIVFFTSKYLSNLMAGLLFMGRTICDSFGVRPLVGCLSIMSGFYVVIGSFITHTLLAYIDMYVALQNMAINDPRITRKRAALLSMFTWIIWLGIGALGFLFPNAKYENHAWLDYSQEPCVAIYPFHASGYRIFVLALRGVLIITIMAMYFATSRLLTKSIQNNLLHRDESKPDASSTEVESEQQPSNLPYSISHRRNAISTDALNQTKKAKYLEDRKEVLKILAIKAWIMMISWGLIVVCGIVNELCAQCKENFPEQLNFLLQLCHILPIISNGCIYMIYNKDLRAACHRCCCMCRSTCEPM